MSPPFLLFLELFTARFAAHSSFEVTLAASFVGAACTVFRFVGGRDNLFLEWYNHDGKGDVHHDGNNGDDDVHLLLAEGGFPPPPPPYSGGRADDDDSTNRLA